jgi:hypothetical protein
MKIHATALNALALNADAWNLLTHVLFLIPLGGARRPLRSDIS